MAYSIVYGQPSGGQRAPAETGRLAGMVSLALAIFLLLTCFFWPEGKAALGEILLPGDREASGRAFSTMVAELREGTPMSEAVTTFCREILCIEED